MNTLISGRLKSNQGIAARPEKLIRPAAVMQVSIQGRLPVPDPAPEAVAAVPGPLQAQVATATAAPAQDLGLQRQEKAGVQEPELLIQ